MNLIRRFFLMFGLAKEPTIDSITSPMAKIVAKLESYAQEQTKRAETDAEAADRLVAKSVDEARAAKEAMSLAGRYATLTMSPAE